MGYVRIYFLHTNEVTQFFLQKQDVEVMIEQIIVHKVALGEQVHSA